MYVAGDDALDQFFCRHPDEFLERSVEAAILDHESEQIHIACERSGMVATAVRAHETSPRSVPAVMPQAPRRWAVRSMMPASGSESAAALSHIELVADESVDVLRPAPLSEQGTAALVTDRLGPTSVLDDLLASATAARATVPRDGGRVGSSWSGDPRAPRAAPPSR